MLMTTGVTMTVTAGLTLTGDDHGTGQGRGGPYPRGIRPHTVRSYTKPRVCAMRRFFLVLRLGASLTIGS